MSLADHSEARSLRPRYPIPWGFTELSQSQKGTFKEDLKSIFLDEYFPYGVSSPIFVYWTSALLLG